ncbi:hypothetical protein MLD38_030432 [Melastoma candidum]|uniref:Uncharacterized protein n=1 Tax=Melastoma candidum TaxID=119954 RepID=A0ACB9MRU9_9MYRT|nr:hypothetical protein MLD38_030432 [Melastoma candidum]
MNSSDNAISGDLEGGQKNPSASAGLVTSGEAAKFKIPMNEFVFSKIFRRFDPTRTTTQQKALLLLCVAAVIIDPLFFYIPMINERGKCMKSDWKIGVFAISWRSVVDILHLVLWSFYYERKWKAEGPKPRASTGPAPVAPSTEVPPCSPNRHSKVTGRLIEILSVLPLPQATTLAILIMKGNPRSQHTVALLKFLVLIQFILRAFRVFPSFHEATTNSVTLLKSRFWIGAGFNLLLFTIASHVLGAFWYLLSVGRIMDCWKSACRNRGGCNIDSLYCGGPTDNKSYLDDLCPIQPTTNSSSFNFGIYLSALELKIVGSIRFQLKLSYCFWWGLRNLSSLGQNLATSAYEWEIFFSICISILGLILFSLFIGNMQAYFQYQTNQDLKNMKAKMDKIMKKQRDLSNWHPFQWLPPDLKEDVISCVEDNWLKTTEVNLQTVLKYLPNDLSKKIKERIDVKLRTQVKFFRTFNTQAINRLKPEVFTQESLVFKKDDPIDRMVFILTGKLTKQSGNDGSKDEELGPWKFCGEEVLKELISGSSPTQSSSTTDVRACEKVEAFVLERDDIRSVLDQTEVTFKRIKKLFEDPKTKQKMKAAGKPTGMTIGLNESRTVFGPP